MSEVLGVSAGAGFVRLVQLHRTATLAGPERQALEVCGAPPETVAAQAVGVLRADAGAPLPVCLAYGDEAQAAALDAALHREGVTGFRLVPELTAVLERLHHDERLRPFGVVVVYDLGWSGLTVTVVDRRAAAVIASERSGALRLDRFTDVPRETADAAIAASADLVGDLSAQSAVVPEAVVLLGGGAHVDYVRTALARHCAVPILVPERPEYAAADGAALLAASLVASVPAGRETTAEPHEPTGPHGPHGPSGRRPMSRRQAGGVVLAAAVLLVLAVIGVGLGTDVFTRSEADAPPGSAPTSAPAVQPASAPQSPVPSVMVPSAGSVPPQPE